jgi:hypothetical protein
MIRHVVMFRFEDSVTEAQIAELSSALDALPSSIPEIVAYRHGRDLGLAPTNFDYTVTADFADVGGYTTYRDHPEHRRFIAEHITGKVSERTAVQFEFTD